MYHLRWSWIALRGVVEVSDAKRVGDAGVGTGAAVWQSLEEDEAVGGIMASVRESEWTSC